MTDAEILKKLTSVIERESWVETGGIYRNSSKDISEVIEALKVREHFRDPECGTDCLCMGLHYAKKHKNCNHDKEFPEDSE